MFPLRTSAWNGRPCSSRVSAAQVVLICSFSLLVGCSDEKVYGPSPPRDTGSVRVQAVTTGEDVDPDGYLINVDGSRYPFRLGVNGSITIPGLAFGSHVLTPNDVALNCQVDAAEPIVRISTRGESVRFDVRVRCSAFGSVLASLVTTGTDIDETGYRVIIAAPNAGFPAFGTTLQVPPNGTASVPRVPPGRHLVWLQGVAGNCVGSNLTPREVDVVSGEAAGVSFELVCMTPTRIAYAASDASGNSEIYTVRSNRSGTTRLTNHPGKDEDPAWSPDGTRIAFTSNRDGTAAVHVMREDGSGATRLTPATVPSYRPAWSPDGNRIAFVSERDGNAELYVMQADGSNQVRLTNNVVADGDPAWSPDGSRLAFASKRDGNEKIYVMNADGSGVARITTGESADRQPAWSPDGATIAFSRVLCATYSASACWPAVMLTTPSGATPKEVGLGEDPAWSPDGVRIAATRFVCDFYGVYCTVTGIGLVSPGVIETSWHIETWEPELTKGTHHNPSWRP